MKREGRCDHKVPGGKLIRVVVEEGESGISDVRIYGDFFLYPEEAMDRIEEMALEMVDDLDGFQKRLDEYLSREDVEIFGAGAEGIRFAVEGAVKNLE